MAGPVLDRSDRAHCLWYGRRPKADGMGDYEMGLEEMMNSGVLSPGKDEDPVLWLQRMVVMLASAGEEDLIDDVESVILALAHRRLSINALGERGLPTTGPDIDAQVERLRGLDDAWHEGNVRSVAPLQGTVTAAEEFARRCVGDHGVSAPFLFPMTNGGIEVAWCWPDGRARALVLFSADWDGVTCIPEAGGPLVKDQVDEEVYGWVVEQMG